MICSFLLLLAESWVMRQEWCCYKTQREHSPFFNKSKNHKRDGPKLNSFHFKWIHDWILSSFCPLRPFHFLFDLLSLHLFERKWSKCLWCNFDSFTEISLMSLLSSLLWFIHWIILEQHKGLFCCLQFKREWIARTRKSHRLFVAFKVCLLLSCFSLASPFICKDSIIQVIPRNRLLIEFVWWEKELTEKVERVFPLIEACVVNELHVCKFVVWDDRKMSQGRDNLWRNQSCIHEINFLNAMFTLCMPLMVCGGDCTFGGGPNNFHGVQN